MYSQNNPFKGYFDGQEDPNNFEYSEFKLKIKEKKSFPSNSPCPERYKLLT